MVDRLLQLTPCQFEEFVADYLREQGYRDVRVVGRAGDRGVDITCQDDDGRRVVVQCKKYQPTAAIGAPQIQTFFGVVAHHRAARGIFATTTRFTNPARRHAEETDIELLDGVVLGRHAEAVEQRRRSEEERRRQEARRVAEEARRAAEAARRFEEERRAAEEARLRVTAVPGSLDAVAEEERLWRLEMERQDREERGVPGPVPGGAAVSATAPASGTLRPGGLHVGRVADVAVGRARAAEADGVAKTARSVLATASVLLSAGLLMAPGMAFCGHTLRSDWGDPGRTFYLCAATTVLGVVLTAFQDSRTLLSRPTGKTVRRELSFTASWLLLFAGGVLLADQRDSAAQALWVGSGALLLANVGAGGWFEARQQPRWLDTLELLFLPLLVACSVVYWSTDPFRLF